MQGQATSLVFGAMASALTKYGIFITCPSCCAISDFFPLGISSFTSTVAFAYSSTRFASNLLCVLSKVQHSEKLWSVSTVGILLARRLSSANVCFAAAGS